MKKLIKLSLLILSLLSVLPSCKEEENENKPVLNNFYISSNIDATGEYRTSTLDIGNTYYGMLNISSEDAKVASVTVTQVRISDSYTIPSFTISTPSISGNNFMLVAQISPKIAGTWNIYVYATDSNGNKSNTLSLQVDVFENGKYLITFDGNGATSGSMADQSLSVGNMLSPNQFVKEGYRFTGWNRAVDGSDIEYEDKESFSIKHKGNDMNYPRHVTFYAQWAENLPTIRISLEDNSARTILPSIDYNDYSFRIDGFNDKNATVSKTWQNKDKMTSDVLELSEGTWQFTLTAIDKTNEEECLQGNISNVVLKNGDSKTLNFSLAVTNKGTGSIYCIITYPSESIETVTVDFYKITEESSGIQEAITIQNPGTAIYSNNSVEAGLYYLNLYLWYNEETREKLHSQGTQFINIVQVVGGATSTANINI